MRIIWSPGREYQAFADPAERYFSLNGDRLHGKDDEFVGRSLAPGLMLVVSESGAFGDIDGFPVTFIAEALELPTAEPSGSEELVTEVTSRSALLYLDEDARRVVIRLCEGEPERWVRVGSSEVILGLRGEQLWAICCEDVGTGEAEGAWMDAHGF